MIDNLMKLLSETTMIRKLSLLLGTREATIVSSTEVIRQIEVIGVKDLTEATGVTGVTEVTGTIEQTRTTGTTGLREVRATHEVKGKLVKRVIVEAIGALKETALPIQTQEVAVTESAVTLVQAILIIATGPESKTLTKFMQMSWILKTSTKKKTLGMTWSGLDLKTTPKLVLEDLK